MVTSSANTPIFSDNLTEWDKLFKKRDFQNILKDKDLFWLTYCSTLVHEVDDRFKIDITDRNVTIFGKKEILQTLQEVVEKTRLLFHHIFEGNRKGSYSIQYQKDEVIYTTSLNNCLTKLETTLYNPLFVSSLEDLAILSGLHNDFIQPETLSCDKNVTVSCPNYLKHQLYQLSLQKKDCDFKLNSSLDNTEFEVHTSILISNGGEFFKNLVTNNFSEAKRHSVNLEFSSKTISKFIEFIYLGEIALKYLFDEEDTLYDMFNLYHFSDMYCINTFKKIILKKIQFQTKFELDELNNDF